LSFAAVEVQLLVGVGGWGGWVGGWVQKVTAERMADKVRWQGGFGWRFGLVGLGWVAADAEAEAEADAQS
jgi:hypothetical protein